MTEDKPIKKLASKMTLIGSKARSTSTRTAKAVSKKVRAVRPPEDTVFRYASPVHLGFVLVCDEYLVEEEHVDQLTEHLVALLNNHSYDKFPEYVENYCQTYGLAVPPDCLGGYVETVLFGVRPELRKKMPRSNGRLQLQEPDPRNDGDAFGVDSLDGMNEQM